MGSSKKSSDKDKERDREVRKKRRDRSRDRETVISCPKCKVAWGPILDSHSDISIACHIEPSGRGWG